MGEKKVWFKKWKKPREKNTNQDESISFDFFHGFLLTDKFLIKILYREQNYWGIYLQEAISQEFCNSVLLLL